MTQNSNDDITMETLEIQITLETLDHLIIMVDGKLEKNCTNGKTFFYIKKLEKELSRKLTHLLAQISFSNNMQNTITVNLYRDQISPK